MLKIVCVTACPTGIAHTYIAAEMLLITGKKMGFQMKVETHGAIGIENKLSDKDIEESIGVIIAADIHIDKKRFENKKLIETSTQEAIGHAQKLINQLVKIDL